MASGLDQNLDFAPVRAVHAHIYILGSFSHAGPYVDVLRGVIVHGLRDSLVDLNVALERHC